MSQATCRPFPLSPVASLDAQSVVLTVRVLQSFKHFQTFVRVFGQVVGLRVIAVVAILGV